MSLVCLKSYIGLLSPGVRLSHLGLLKLDLLLRVCLFKRIMAPKLEGPTGLKVEGFFNFLCEKGSVLNSLFGQ